jgi:hypothetical protein
VQVPSKKAAPTVVGAVMPNEHEPAPEQVAPLHPAKVEPADAVADNVRVVPPKNRALQVAPQFMPDGVEVTSPVPPPLLLTVTENTEGR